MYIARFRSENHLDKHLDKIHIGLLLFGFIFFISCAFYKSMWFDEAYTLALVKQSIFNIINITSYDVHPPLYYLILKIMSFIFGEHIIVYRVISVLGIFLLAGLGYTHIRKLFGNYVGIYYTFLLIFVPIMLEYSSEVRMYSWAAFFTTASSIYAYITYKTNAKKDWILLIFFSVCAAYTHYYALLGIMFVNLTLLIAVMLDNKHLLKNYFIAALIQILLFVPWAFILIRQTMSVVQEYWIVIQWNYLLKDFFSFYFGTNIPFIIAVLLTSLLIIFSIITLYICFKNAKDNVIISIVCLFIYFGVIVTALILSIIKPIFIVRYLMPNTGILIIAISILLASYQKKIIPATICGIILLSSIFNFYFQATKIYSYSNYLLENNIEYSLKPDDIFVYTDIHPAGIYSVLYPNNKHFVFFDDENAIPDHRPKPFYPELKIVYNLNDLTNYEGRIWLIEGSDSQSLYGVWGAHEEMFKVIDYARTFDMPYLGSKGFVFVTSFFEKKLGVAPKN